MKLFAIVMFWRGLALLGNRGAGGFSEAWMLPSRGFVPVTLESHEKMEPVN
jgi:hypothetical protein